MNQSSFFSLYIPALRKAIENENVNHVNFVKGPEFYIDYNYMNEINSFINANDEYSDFFGLVDIYFDAKSHLVDKIENINTEEYKKILIMKIDEIEKNLNLQRKK